MAATDPRTTIRSGVVANIGAITKDDGILNASVVHLWEGGPETLNDLFYVDDYDVVITYGDPNSRSDRDIQDVPVHFLMSYPIVVTTADKPLIGVMVCTAARMQYKVTYALRSAIASFAQSAIAATPAYTLTLKSDASIYKRVGGIYVWETRHVAEYQTDYA